MARVLCGLAYPGLHRRQPTPAHASVGWVGYSPQPSPYPLILTAGQTQPGRPGPVSAQRTASLLPVLTSPSQPRACPLPAGTAESTIVRVPVSFARQMHYLVLLTRQQDLEEEAEAERRRCEEGKEG